TSVTLDGTSSTPGVTYSWTGPLGFTSTSATPSVNAPGIYTLTVLNPANTCSNSDTVTVTQDITLPVASAGADKALNCTITSVTLDGTSTTPGASYSWTGPLGFTSTSATPSVSAPGIYTLTVLNPANTCSNSDTVTVTQDITLPVASAGADKALNCTITSVTLDGTSSTPGVTYSWTGPLGFTSTSATPSVSAPGIYTLTVLNPANTRSTSDTVTVTQDITLPVASAGADKALNCTITSVTLDGTSSTPGVTYSWTGPLGFTSTSATPSVSAPGIYTL